MRTQTLTLKQITPAIFAQAFAVDISNGRAKLYFAEEGDSARTIVGTLRGRLNARVSKAEEKRIRDMMRRR